MSDFQILSEREHLIRRYEMYLGSKSVDPISGIIGFKYQTKYVIPALLKLIEEIYQNSTDEGTKF